MENKKLDSQAKAIAKYKKNNIKKMYLEVNIKTEADILEKLESVPSRATYLKNLIREDIKRSKKS